MTTEPSASTSRTPSSGGRVFGIVMIVGTLVFGLAVGYRLGSSDVRPPVAAVPAPTPHPTITAPPITAPPSTPEPSPAPPTFPPPLIQGATVDESLRQAYYAGGAGTSVCDVSGEVPVCHSRRLLAEVPDPGTNGSVDFERLWDAGPVEHITYGAAVVVEDISADQVVAQLYNEAWVSTQPLGPIVNEGQRGVYYIDIHGFDSGRNVVMVRTLSFDRSSEVGGATWHANVIAFDVTYPPRPTP